MPIVCIIGAVVLQAASYGYISGRFDSSGSLYLACVGFASAAVIFNLVHAVRRRTASAADAAPPRPAGRLLLLMNIVTAVTFLGFYASLAWIPSALASGVEAAVGPLAVALLALTGHGRRASPRGWLAAVLLIALGAAVAVSLSGGASSGQGMLLGLALVVVAGFGASALAVISGELGRRGVDPVRTTAHRFHLTYLAGAALLMVQGGPGEQWAQQLPAMLLTGLAAVTAPLFLLQVGIQRADSMIAMVLLTTVPGLTYLAETVFHGGFDELTFALIVGLIAVAVWAALPGRERSRRLPHSSGNRTPSARTTVESTEAARFR
ncbi:DMT family transporter [Streptomyces niger]|uniref:EamA family transporter n=1 Tax=Streptomyces niger TaxID=66373 RepID=UPI00069976D3|nr:EamA family transporter [Streptomyces niger]